MTQNPRVTSGTLLSVPAGSFVMWESFFVAGVRSRPNWRQQAIFFVQSLEFINRDFYPPWRSPIRGFSLATASPKGFEALGVYTSAVEEAPGGELLEGTLVTR